MFPKSQFGKAVFLWFFGLCFLAGFLVFGLLHGEWHWYAGGAAVMFFVCGYWAYQYAPRKD